MTLAEKVRARQPGDGNSRWRGHEYGRGYAVLTLPFDSGHLLGLRVFPEHDFAPYVSVWHRPPGEDWAIYVDGPSIETACPRYWGPVTSTAGFASIEVTWTDPAELRVEMDEPALVWRLSMSTSPLLRAVNRVNAAMPGWTWRVGALLRVREWVARHYLGYGDIRLSFTSASGHDVVLVAAENYPIDASTATLDGLDLGEPEVLDENPTVGDVPLPRAPSFVLGQAQAAIRDRAEYQRLKRQVSER